MSSLVVHEQKRKSFYCYLIRSKHPQHARSTYIGFTMKPTRRIKQHNGQMVNGAYRTNRKRPWEFAVIVKGFPTKISALQFEWAWQHPHKHKQIKHHASGLHRKVGTKAKLHILAILLGASPWSQYSLSLNFTSDEMKSQFDEAAAHLPGGPLLFDAISSTVGPHDQAEKSVVIVRDMADDLVSDSGGSSCESDSESVLDESINLEDSDEDGDDGGIHSSTNKASASESNHSNIFKDLKVAGLKKLDRQNCTICTDILLGPVVSCLSCNFKFHVLCLAKYSLGGDFRPESSKEDKTLDEQQQQQAHTALLLPQTGTCPRCLASSKWGEIIQKTFRVFSQQPQGESAAA